MTEGEDGATGQRPTGHIDVYRRATDAMRETTRWIVTFIPGTAVVVTSAVFLPDLARVPTGERGPIIALVCLAGLATVIAIGLAARVLSASETGWGSTIRAYNASAHSRPIGSAGEGLAADLDSEQVLRLYGYTSAAEFFDDLATSDTELAPAAVAAGTAVMDFAAYRTVRQRFLAFVVGGTVAAITALALLGAAQIQAAGHLRADLDPRITPLAATLSLTEAGEDVLTQRADCDLTAAGLAPDVLVLGGSLDAARILVDDARCTPTVLDWQATEHGLIVPTRD